MQSRDARECEVKGARWDVSGRGVESAVSKQSQRRAEVFVFPKRQATKNGRRSVSHLSGLAGWTGHCSPLHCASDIPTHIVGCPAGCSPVAGLLWYAPVAATTAQPPEDRSQSSDAADGRRWPV